MMNREVGNPAFPIWLLGDSNPPRWEVPLLTPLDPRHPVRHNIWTSVLDIIQDRVFRQRRMRVDTSSLYIRNAVESPNLKPKPSHLDWEGDIQQEVDELRRLLSTYTPRLIMSFGAFAFEFARRAMDESIKQKYGSWGAKKLGIAFQERISAFDPSRINLIPLLHRSISGEMFVQSHHYFSGSEGANYFEIVGNSIADRLLDFHDQLEIWIK